MNRVQKDKQVMMLLGAGASAPPIPTTRNLTDWLCADFRRWRLPGPNDPPTLRAADTQGPHDLRQPYFDALHDVMRRSYGNRADLLTFETLLHTAWLLSEAGREPSHWPVPFRPWMNVNPAYQSLAIDGLPSIIHEACNGLLLRLWKAQKAGQGAGNALSTGILEASNHARLRIFSLNFETSCLDWPASHVLELATGFGAPTGDEGAEEFEPRALSVGDGADHSFYQVHGSVHFGVHNYEEIVRFESPDSAADNRAQLFRRHRQDFTTDLGVAAVIGLRKADSTLLSHTFHTNTLWSRLQGPARAGFLLVTGAATTRSMLL